MDIEDLGGQVCVDDEQELVRRLRSVRKSKYGAFILSHDAEGPSLWGHINGSIAYLHFFPESSARHPGFQPAGMWQTPWEGVVHFIQTDGREANSIDVPSEATVPVELAYKAAAEFLCEPILPPSITWREL